MADATLPVRPLSRGQVRCLGAASLALLVSGFLPSLSPAPGQIAERSLSIVSDLCPRLGQDDWERVGEARGRARAMQDWPSLFNAIAMVEADARLDENVRIRIGVLRNSVDSDQYEAQERVTLLALLPLFVYGAVLVAWAAVRHLWRGHPGVDGTMVALALALGGTESIVFLLLQRVRGGLFVSEWIHFLVLAATALALTSWWCARRTGYRRSFLGAAVFLVAFSSAIHRLALQADAFR